MFILETSNWWFVARQDLAVYLFKKFMKSKRVSILDIGCGTGGTTKKFSEFGNITAIDISLDAIKYASSLGIFKIAICDAQNLCFKDKSFDFVNVFDVLEHLQDDRAAIAEVSRVLKPNKFCLITVPAFKFLWGTHDELSRHFRRYDRKRLKKIIHPNLKIEKIFYWNFFLFFFVMFIRIFSRLVSKFGTAKSDLKKFPDFLNKILLSILRFENYLIKKNLNLPFGVSIVCILKRTGKE